RTRDVRSVRGQHAAADAERLARHERVDRIDLPTAHELIEHAVRIAQETLPVPDRQVPDGSGGQDLCAVEVRARTLLAPVAYVGGRARGGRRSADAAI